MKCVSLMLVVTSIPFSQVLCPIASRTDSSNLWEIRTSRLHRMTRMKAESSTALEEDSIVVQLEMSTGRDQHVPVELRVTVPTRSEGSSGLGPPVILNH